MESIFFELIQIAIGCRAQLSCVPSNQKWLQLMSIAQKQSLTGIIFSAIQQLPPEQWPSRSIVLQWTMITQSIIQQNALSTKVCQELCSQYAKDGFDGCILKGQANHSYYTKQLANLRICGDIDIWLIPQNRTCKNPVMEVIKYLQDKRVVESLCYLHVEVKPVKGVPVEVHLRPSFMNSPIDNIKFLRTFNFDDVVCQKEVDGVLLPVLKPNYDIIFQLNHLYRHLIDEGVGLRQVLDFYFLLKSNIECDKEKVMHIVERLGMKRFAAALMWVLYKVFAMPEEYMLCPISEKDGHFLLEEIMIAGNFGHSDPRMTPLKYERGKTSFQIRRAWRRFKRNSRFLKSYPSEVIWEPFARIIHLWWRKLELWQY